MKKLTSLLFIALSIVGIQCTKVPVSGRSQFSFIGNDKIFPMSFQQYEQVKKEGKIVTGTEESRMVKRVGTRIQRAVEKYFVEQSQPNYLNDYRWEFNLIGEEIVNAWCMPGGKVAFYTGIMSVCETEEGVAVVMGHEVAHAIANHGRERISQQSATQVGLNVVGMMLGAGGVTTIPVDVIMQGTGAVTSLGILSFSRKHERESDKLGLFFMAMAGYNPQTAPKFWERMSANSESKQPFEFMSTHPSHETRISNLNANMPKALEFYKASKK